MNPNKTSYKIRFELCTNGSLKLLYISQTKNYKFFSFNFKDISNSLKKIILHANFM